MKAFEIKTNRSDYPFLVIADGFQKAVEMLYQKGIYDTDIHSVRQLETYKGDHILIEESLTAKEVLRDEVLSELQKDMPRWTPGYNGAAGGDSDIYLIRTSKGHYFTSSCCGGNNHFLVLDTLEQLPGLPKED